MKIMTLWGEEEVSNTRMCIHCKEVKHEDEFGVRSYTKNGIKAERRNDCNSCKSKQTKIRNELKRQYPRPTNEDYQCPRCNRSKQDFINEGRFVHTNKKSMFVLDHDHKTGQFRGWICDYCNTICARAYDDPSILEANARVLREFELLRKQNPQ